MCCAARVWAVGRNLLKARHAAKTVNVAEEPVEEDQEKFQEFLYFFGRDSSFPLNQFCTVVVYGDYQELEGPLALGCTS